jgi:pimeloyl-ACP methyl ester carboxylesterase
MTIRAPILLLFVLVGSMSSHAATHILVIHGYGSTKLFVEGIARYLREHDLNARTWTWPSLTKDVEESGELLAAKLATLPATDTVSFVTHSMGAIVVRVFLDRRAGDTAMPVIGRIVMIAPPNHGSELGNFFADWHAFHWLMGPNPALVRIDSSSYVNTMPDPPAGTDIGIIAGTAFTGNANPLFDTLHDGYISVNRTRLGCESDFITVKGSHSFLIHDSRVKENVLHFLRHGSFMHQEGTTKR